MLETEVIEFKKLIKENKVIIDFLGENIYVDFDNLNEFISLLPIDVLSHPQINCALGLGCIIVNLSDICSILMVDKQTIYNE